MKCIILLFLLLAILLASPAVAAGTCTKRLNGQALTCSLTAKYCAAPNGGATAKTTDDNNNISFDEDVCVFLDGEKHDLFNQGSDNTATDAQRYYCLAADPTTDCTCKKFNYTTGCSSEKGRICSLYTGNNSQGWLYSSDPSCTELTTGKCRESKQGTVVDMGNNYCLQNVSASGVCTEIETNGTICKHPTTGGCHTVSTGEAGFTMVNATNVTCQAFNPATQCLNGTLGLNVEGNYCVGSNAACVVLSDAAGQGQAKTSATNSLCTTVTTSTECITYPQYTKIQYAHPSNVAYCFYSTKTEFLTSKLCTLLYTYDLVVRELSTGICIEEDLEGGTGPWRGCAVWDNGSGSCVSCEPEHELKPTECFPTAEHAASHRLFLAYILLFISIFAVL